VVVNLRLGVDSRPNMTSMATVQGHGVWQMTQRDRELDAVRNVQKSYAYSRPPQRTEENSPANMD
jgi:hypothetical protein